MKTGMMIKMEKLKKLMMVVKKMSEQIKIQEKEKNKERALPMLTVPHLTRCALSSGSVSVRRISRVMLSAGRAVKAKVNVKVKVKVRCQKVEAAQEEEVVRTQKVK